MSENTKIRFRKMLILAEHYIRIAPMTIRETYIMKRRDIYENTTKLS